VQIFCNGVEVMVCGGTKEKYIVDVWSGNHPFYQGAKSTIVMDDGRVSKFNKMYPDAVGTMGCVH
jgi:large subunit ribosomal protein L31